MRQNFVAGNWKMNLTLPQAQALTTDLMQALGEHAPAAQVVVCPPFPLLAAVGHLLGAGQNPALGAQNFHQHERGAYTGEVSAEQLQSVGCRYVILGHSERRQHHHETDVLLAHKLRTALAAGLLPIFCVGESLATREADKTFDFIGQQLAAGLFHLGAEEFGRVVVAYEPIWAIGTGRTASTAQAQQVHACIRGQVAQAYGPAVAQATTIVYGGSCNAQNARELFAQPDVDGGLIGGASLKAADFVAIVQSF